MTKNKKQIISVTIKKTVDDSPDTSHLGKYAERPTSRFSINREHDTDCATQAYNVAHSDQECNCSGGSRERNEYRYFNPSFNYVNDKDRIRDGLSSDDVHKYVKQDYERMESLNAGNWCYLGVTAEAKIQVNSNVVQTIRSGGLWGIESDSNESYFKEVEQEQLAELRSQLRAIGFTTRAIDTAFDTRRLQHAA